MIQFNFSFFSISRSKGEAKAMFLRHEGFLGALGAFRSYEKLGVDNLEGKFLVSQVNEDENLECKVYTS